MAIITPVFLLFVMAVADFGRVYLGWINLQTMARSAANYAANNSDGWEGAGDPAKQARYEELIQNDATRRNCSLDPDPDTRRPTFPYGYDLGDLVEVSISCEFNILTPILSNFLGGTLSPTASATMPVTTGATGSAIGGGGPVVPAPIAEFVGAPQSGYAPLTVSFTDTSTGSPTTWLWNFGDGDTDIDQNPTHTYTSPGLYTVRLWVNNGYGGPDILESKDDYIEVLPPPSSGPVPEFSGSPLFGEEPLRVVFTDLSTGGATSWQWSFGDGTTSTSQNPDHTYGSPGSYDVTLTVSDGTTSNTQTKPGYVNVTAAPCVVPDLQSLRRDAAATRWYAAGFDAGTFSPTNGSFTVQRQSIAGGTIPVQGCAATITVYPN
jgi:PKD repeat protein